MYEAGDLKKGRKIELDNEPYIVTRFEFAKPGKGKSFYKCKLKNMLTGVQFDKTFRSGERLKQADIEQQEMEYLYSDGKSYCFMHPLTYDQIFLTKDQIADAIQLLKENMVCEILLFDKNPIGITLPNFVELRITKADPWVKGDRTSGDSKSVELETGYVLQVPSFIEEGELIRIDSRTGQYVERVKDN
jgi:elongation factor P